MKRNKRDMNGYATVMSQFPFEAHAIEERYYRINRVILKSLGLWPYQQSFFSRIQKMLFIIILVTCIMAQVSSYIYNFCSVALNNYIREIFVLCDENSFYFLLLFIIFIYNFFSNIIWQYYIRMHYFINNTFHIL
jgi:ABC-type multidrug transport system fused ATPase/permease subunit